MTPELRKRVLAMRAITVSIRAITAVLRCSEAEVVRVLEEAEREEG